MTNALPKRITIPQEVIFETLDDEVVLLNLASERYYSLDDIGTRMWQLLEERGDVEATVPQLLSEFQVDEATLRADLARLIGELKQAGLISVSA